MGGCYGFSRADTHIVTTPLPDGNAPQLIGEHPLIQKINQLVRKVAGTDVTVLIMGESGTGKELIARAIHAQSVRT